ncbi:hypothetical protein B0H34DRAFT_796530 [Crassisporium funariophilum]|nr:hypothetical protein B0H34DRAFT_796530 [Crassisporium funariophilum]
MQVKAILFAFTQALAALALERRDPPTVLTAKRVYHTIIEQSPFLVEATSTVVWTQSPSITEALPTDIPVPTID